MSAASFTAGLLAPSGLGGGLARLLRRRLPPGRRLLGRGTPANEAGIASIGPVELRRTRAAYVLRTVVKGEHDAALHTALQRLADYARGYNHPGLPVRVARPVVQLPGAPGTWLVRIGLPGVYAATAAPTPRSGKVRIMAQPSETLAIIRLSGHPEPQVFAQGEAAIMAALAGSAWVPAGPVMLRLHTPLGVLPWSGGFEVAVAVTEA
ncbi:MAG TPA: heme-binding protein [Acetobacteraceae bacterium]|jgi:hypothetical protein|nr:heme-binding protein [Acetobacteraceae bacterium]